MKNRKRISVILYIAILVLLFTWVLGLFDSKSDGVPYSQVVAFFQQGQVKSFVVDDGYIYLELYEPYKEKSIVVAEMADPEGFRQDMWTLLQEQSASGVLESYNFTAEDKLSPYDFILPIILAGLAILLVWTFLAGRANQSNPMANFGKARTGIGQPGGKKVTFQDVAGVDEEKAELQEVVDFLRNPQKFTAIGAKIPHGIEGLFERLHELMPFDESLLLFYEEPELLGEWFDKCADYKIDTTAKIFENYGRIDGVLYHDDWGTQRAGFFSNEMFREMLFPYEKKFFDFVKGQGKFVELHSCGRNMQYVPTVVSVGPDREQTIIRKEIF